MTEFATMLPLSFFVVLELLLCKITFKVAGLFKLHLSLRVTYFHYWEMSARSKVGESERKTEGVFVRVQETHTQTETNK